MTFIKKGIVSVLALITVLGLTPGVVLAADEVNITTDTIFTANSVNFLIMNGSIADEIVVYSGYLDFTLSANSTVEIRSYARYLFTSGAANTDCSNASYSKLVLPAYATQTTVRVTPTSDTCPASGGGGGGGGSSYVPPSNNTNTDTDSGQTNEGTDENTSGESQAMAKPEDYGLQEGDLIRAIGDVDIFIINNQGYKRLFLNPAIFEMYGHLGSWDDVIEVAPSTRDAFKTSNHYRYVGEDKVYHLEITGDDTAQLRWLNMTGEAFQNQGGKAEGIFTINQDELNWYPQGSEMTEL